MLTYRIYATIAIGTATIAAYLLLTAPLITPGGYQAVNILFAGASVVFGIAAAEERELYLRSRQRHPSARRSDDR